MNKTDRLLNSMRARPEIKQPIASDMFVPNHSGIASNPEATNNFLKLNCSNDPLTGDLEISKADPLLKFTDTGNNNYSTLSRADTDNKLSVINRCESPALSSYDITVDGGAHYGTIPTDATLNKLGDVGANGDFTVAVWVYPTANDGDQDCVITKRGAAGAGWFIAARPTSTRWQFFLYDGAHLLQQNTDAGSLTLDTWHRIVVTVDRNTGLADGEVKFYINGDLKKTWTDSVSGDASIDGTNLSVANAGGIPQLIGKVDEILIYNTVKDQAWVTADYNGGAGTYTTSTTNLVAGYHFNEGSGTTVDNFEGTAGRDMTLVAGTVWNAGTKSSPDPTPTTNDITVFTAEDGDFFGTKAIINVGDSNSKTFINGSQIKLLTLPTANPAVAGALWNDGGTVKISAG